MKGEVTMTGMIKLKYNARRDEWKVREVSAPYTSLTEGEWAAKKCAVYAASISSELSDLFEDDYERINNIIDKLTETMKEHIRRGEV